MKNAQPGLFGLKKTNVDLTQKESWGKNRFNSSFPAALCCYLASKNIDANHLVISGGKFKAAFVPISNVFGIDADDDLGRVGVDDEDTVGHARMILSLPINLSDNA